MLYKFFLAILIGVVIRFISAIVIEQYAKTGKTNDELREYRGFHVSVLAYIIGSIFKYVGLTLLLADLIKTYILT